jgi:signal transduction histidine kinase
LTFKAKLIGGTAAAAFVLLLASALSYTSLQRSTADREWVTHTHVVLEKLDDIQTSLVDSEDIERAYILLSDDSYLESYRGSVAQVGLNIKEVRQLTADNPKQQRALDHLEPLVAARFSAMQECIDVRRNEGLPAAIVTIQTKKGKQLMHQLRDEISAMKLEENRLLTIRAAELIASSRSARFTILFGDSLGFLFLCAAGFVIQQEMSRRRRVEDEVRRLNVDLERRVAERTAELAERAKDLERSNMELQQFAYVASHDLQEPLRTISSFTQLLAKRYQDKLDDKAGEFIGFTVDGCKRMQTLINDLLAFSRVGTQGKPMEVVDCDQLVSRVLKSLRRAVDDSGAVITKEALPVVIADEGQLSQLFQNLLGNAMKFRGREAPRIHISAEPNGLGWKIVVRDNGIGISEDHKDRIFVIFQRLHTKKEYPGTGIGLAICKKIVERHGGKIWVEPSPGGGSTFCFTIPAGMSADTQEQEQYELRTNAAAN